MIDELTEWSMMKCKLYEQRSYFRLINFHDKWIESRMKKVKLKLKSKPVLQLSAQFKLNQINLQ